MPWKETDTMKERHLLISDYLSNNYTISDLSEIYGISRKTVYKWIERYKLEGFDGLSDRSRCPRNIPHRTDQARLDICVDVKAQHPSWGPRKIVRYLESTKPETQWPAPSTVGYWFNKFGLVIPQRKRRRVSPYTQPFKNCNDSNSVWSADFKGQFKTKDGKYCYPLTISDNYSRYLLECRGLHHPNYKGCRRWFEWTFRKYGLPEAIRTDNGTPFAGLGKGGLSRLSIWWIKLGIVPERIEKGKPQQNGRHERMHRTLKDATANPASKDLMSQQVCFENFVREYNELRPHEALKDKTPASVYSKSKRSYPHRILKMEYDSDYIVRSVRHNGEIKFKGNLLFVSELLAKDRIGLKQVSEQYYELVFGFHPLGRFNIRTGRIEPMQ